MRWSRYGLPVVELVAKKIIEREPDIGLSVVDLIVMLWLFTNPYDTTKRQLTSIRYMLKLCESVQSPGQTTELSDDELTQIILGSLDRLKGKHLAYLRSKGQHYVRAVLTESGKELINKSIPTSQLKRIISEFGNSF
jgi:hypothetical protein